MPDLWKRLVEREARRLGIIEPGVAQRWEQLHAAGWVQCEVEGSNQVFRWVADHRDVDDA